MNKCKALREKMENPKLPPWPDELIIRVADIRQELNAILAAVAERGL